MSPSPEHKRSWSWKTKDTRLGMRYEPGNWGDVIKGTWALLVTRALLSQLSPSTRFVYRDPFAGAPVYPLIDAAKERLQWIGGGTFYRAQSSASERGELASTASLVRWALEAAPHPYRLEVWDREERFRAAWEESGASLLSIRTGEEGVAMETPASLTLVDPYDLFDRWEEIFPHAVAAARNSAVLLYLYNKAPRGGGYARRSDTLRKHLKNAKVETKWVGRIPSDLSLPRAYHEMVLLAPDASVPDELLGELTRATRHFACRMSTGGAFEELSR